MRTLDFRDKKVLVVGLARSGIAAANFLVRKGARVTASDRKTAEELKREIEQLERPVHLSLGRNTVEDFLRSDLVVLSPGVPSSIEGVRAAREAGVPVWSEVELAYRFLRGSVIGITGSNGKTTTTTLVGEMFRIHGGTHDVAGNIGKPLIQAVAESDGTPRKYVVELSSFQLENIHRFRCHVAVLLNITPDHLDRYPDFESYACAKKNIFLNQNEKDFAVLNADDPVASRLMNRSAAATAGFSRRAKLLEGAYTDGPDLVVAWRGVRTPILPISEIRIRGLHNLENSLAASMAATLAGLPAECIAEALRSFPGVEHRLEFAGRIRGIDFYNDSKATNVDSAARALDSFARPLLVIMGGLDKGGDFRALRPLMEGRVKRLVLIGQAASRIGAALGDSIPTSRAGSLEEAVSEALRHSTQGDIVLLSPACASFDMFENYEHRGRVFKETVRLLGKSSDEGAR